MELDSALRVIVMIGLYDSPCCEPERCSVSLVEADLRGRVKLSCYVGGHMMYTDTAARREMKRDMSDLVRTAIAANPAPAH
jgi:hypothetical protein